MKKLLLLAFGITISAFAFIGLGSTAYGQAGTSIPQNFGPGDSAAHGGVNVAGGSEEDKQDSIIDVIKNFVNYTLGFLGLIALLMLMRGGFKMVTAGGDEGAYKEGFKILKNAGFGIAFIGVAWLIVTFIFYVFSLVTS